MGTRLTLGSSRGSARLILACGDAFPHYSVHMDHASLTTIMRYAITCNRRADFHRGKAFRRKTEINSLPALVLSILQGSKAKPRVTGTVPIPASLWQLPCCRLTRTGVH